jgi:hypothetical protein
MPDFNLTAKASAAIARLVLQQRMLNEAEECCFNMTAENYEAVLAKVTKSCDALVNTGKLYNDIYEKVTAIVKARLLEGKNGPPSTDVPVWLDVDSIIASVVADPSIESPDLRKACEDYLAAKKALDATKDNLEDVFYGAYRVANPY